MYAHKLVIGIDEEGGNSSNPRLVLVMRSNSVISFDIGLLRLFNGQLGT